MPQVSDAVAQAAAYYRANDHAAAARFDSTLPGTPDHPTLGMRAGPVRLQRVRGSPTSSTASRR